MAESERKGRGVRNKSVKKRIKGKYKLAGRFMCARGRGDQGKPGLCTSIILKGRVNIRVHPALIKTFWPEGELDHCSWLRQDTHHMCKWGRVEVRDWGGMGTAGGTFETV